MTASTDSTSNAADPMAYFEERRRLIENPPAPVVGMPATYGVGSDSYAMVVTYVSPTGHLLKAAHLDKDDDLTSVHPSDEGTEFTRRRNGRYMVKGNKNFGYLSLGHASSYRDPSF